MNRALLLAIVFASSTASAQSLRLNSGGTTFVGGTLTAPLILPATETLCSAALSLTYTGDTNMGWQRSAADTLLLCLNGAVAATYATTGITYTVGAVFSGVTTDITAASAEDLRLQGGASTGSVQLMSLDDITDILDSVGNTEAQIFTASGSTNILLRQGSAGSTGSLRLSAAAGFLGSQSSAAATTQVAGIVDGMTVAGGNVLQAWYGSGIQRSALHQAVSCAAGVLALDPQSPVIDVDANGAACAVTIAETSATTIGPGFDVQINIVTSAGAGAVTFPDVANVHDGPTLCTTTGLALNGTYRIHYADKSDDMFLGVACSSN